MLQLDYIVTVPSELAAGLRGFTEYVHIQFEHTDKAMDDNGFHRELTEYFRQAIAEWFDVAPKSVATRIQSCIRDCGSHRGRVKMIEHWDCNCQMCTPKEPAASPAPQPERKGLDLPKCVDPECPDAPHVGTHNEQPAGARDEQLLKAADEYANAHLVGDFERSIIRELLYDFAKKERERADAAERQVEQLCGDVKAIQADYSNAARELRDMREALKEFLAWSDKVKTMAYIPTNAYDEFKAKAEALLSRKGEWS